MTHVMREDLERWRDQGLADDRAQVISHLATCKSCAAMYAEVIRTTPAVSGPARFDPSDFVQRGYAVRRQASARAASVAWTSWKVWAPALGAAALLLFVVVLGPNTRPGSEPSDTRGAQIELVSPAETSTRPSVLEWRSGVTAPRYRVEIMDASGAVLYQTITEALRIELPADIVSTLGSGRSYTWRVTALDADGRFVTSSSRTLSVAPGAK